jgi:hypothetical protein
MFSAKEGGNFLKIISMEFFIKIINKFHIIDHTEFVSRPKDQFEVK